MSWLHAVRERARGMLSGGREDAETAEEMRFHLEMEAARRAQEEGLDAVEARRRASLAFGGVDRYREAVRDARGFAGLSSLALDFRLGLRMLLKYPVLALASVLSIAIAVALAVSWFEFTADLVLRKLPFEDGDRLVFVYNADVASANRELRSLHDYELWSRTLESIEDLTAATTVESSVTAEDGRALSVRGARITASAFRLLRVQPQLGRVLLPADEAPDATGVVVIGHDVWQALFDGSPSVIGRTVRFAGTPLTVVGVMPEKFGFPVNHEVWVPLRERAVAYERREGPAILMYGRLAPGVTKEEAQAELTAIGQRTAREHPGTHEQLRPQVRFPGEGNEENLAAAALNVPFLLFLLVVCANIASLVFARTATREGEIALRSALGASRRRIVLQLVTESLVLALVGAALGLFAASQGLKFGMALFWEVQQQKPPYYFDAGLSSITYLYVGLLVVLVALFVGGIPALKATRGGLRTRLAQPGTTGATIRFGFGSTAIIVVQIALCVAFLPLAILAGRELLRQHAGASDFPAHAFVSARLVHEGAGADADDDGAWYDEAVRALAADPGIPAVAVADRLPGFNHVVRPLEVEGDSTARVVRVLAVEEDFFPVMESRVVAGRAFRASDFSPDARVAIVARDWADEVLAGGSMLGQRIRFPARSGDETAPWYDVIGVVEGTQRAFGPGEEVGVFRPLVSAEADAVQLFVRTDGDATPLVPRVHEILAAGGPAIAALDVQPLADVWRPVERSNILFAWALAVVAVVMLLFALIGTYALMSFTVAQRAREIAVRAALGAAPRRILRTIFSRALLQVVLGIAAGAALVSLSVLNDGEGMALVAMVAALMLAVGLGACVLPARRALRIQPTEALKGE